MLLLRYVNWLENRPAEISAADGFRLILVTDVALSRTSWGNSSLLPKKHSTAIPPVDIHRIYSYTTTITKTRGANLLNMNTTIKERHGEEEITLAAERVESILPAVTWISVCCFILISYRHFCRLLSLRRSRNYVVVTCSSFRECEYIFSSLQREIKGW